MSNRTINTLSGSLAPVNAQLEKLQANIEDKLDRVPDSGQMNALEDTLDANSNRIINLPKPQSPNDAARLQDIEDASNVPDVAAAVAVNVKDLGAIGDGVADDTAAIQAAIDAYSLVYIPEGTFRLNSALVPRSGVKVFGVKESTQLFQYGQYLLQQQSPSLVDFTFSDVTIDFRSPSDSRYHGAFALSDHKRCLFSDIRTVRYDDQFIFERHVKTNATTNTIDNTYQRIQVSACAHLDIGIGLEGYYAYKQGDNTNQFLTGLAWPEQLPSSAVVMLESADRVFTPMALNTDYTLAYGAGNVLTVNFTSPLSPTTRVHVWPAQPRTDGNRRPISNNSWVDVKVEYCFIRGHTAVRWLDAEFYRNERILLNQNGAACYEFNPAPRTGQGGDNCTWFNPVTSYLSAGVSDVSTLNAFKFGAGSFFNRGVGIIADLYWVSGGVNYCIGYNDTEQVTLTGTITTNGSTAVVTGSGTKFTEEVTLVGSVPDTIIIDDVKYGIANIVSDTQINLTSVPPANVSNTAIRSNIENQVTYEMNFATEGSGFTNANNRSGGTYKRKLYGEMYGEVTLASGTSNGTVTFPVLHRAPEKYEIRITPTSNIQGSSLNINNVATGSFTFNVVPALGVTSTYAWEVNLKDLN